MLDVLHAGSARWLACNTNNLVGRFWLADDHKFSINLEIAIVFSYSERLPVRFSTCTFAHLVLSTTGHGTMETTGYAFVTGGGKGPNIPFFLL